MDILSIVIIIALVVTIAALFTGIGSMMHGGEFDQKHDTQLMFARVGSQGIVLLLLLISLYLATGS